MNAQKTIPKMDRILANLSSKDFLTQTDAALSLMQLAESDPSAVVPYAAKLVPFAFSKEQKVFFYSHRALWELAGRKDAGAEMIAPVLEGWCLGSKDSEIPERSRNLLDKISKSNPSLFLPFAGQIGKKAVESLQHSDFGTTLLARLAVAEPENAEVRKQLDTFLGHSLSVPKSYDYYHFMTNALRRIIEASVDDKRLDPILIGFAATLKSAFEGNVEAKDGKSTRSMDAFLIYAQKRKDLLPEGIKELAEKAGSDPDTGVKMYSARLLAALNE